MTNLSTFLLRAAFVLILPEVTRVTVVPVPAPVHITGQQAGRSEFIIKKGTDTVAVELFSRDAEALTGEIYQTNGPRTQYTLNLRPDSSISHVELTRQNRAGGTAGISVHFTPALVSAQFSAGGQSEKAEFAPQGKSTPFLAVSFALAEQIVQASHLKMGQSLKFTAVRLGAGDTATLTVTRFHADSASLSMSDVELRVALSPKGEVVGGRHVGQNWTVERKSAK